MIVPPETTAPRPSAPEHTLVPSGTGVDQWDLERQVEEERQTSFRVRYLAEELVRYELLERVGEGSSGAVYVARRKEDGRQVAVKVIKRYGPGRSRMKEQTKREVDVLKTIREGDHPGFTQMIESFSDPFNRYIVLVSTPATHSLYPPLIACCFLGIHPRRRSILRLEAIWRHFPKRTR